MTSTNNPQLSAPGLRFCPSHISWNDIPERSLVKDYPFSDLGHETPDMFVGRTYLQFLWLPESIMPLSLLVPSLLRVNVASSSTGPHPLHTLMESILLSGRSASDKYRVELPQLIANGGGDGELEETMMWYALSYEKNDAAETKSPAGTDEHTEEILADEKWRAKWFERMSRREVAVQLLLHMLLLTLPGLPPIASPKKKKHKRKAGPEPEHEILSQDIVEARVQIYMDKLSTWQIVKGLEDLQMPSSTRATEENDWVQRFFLEVVEPNFRNSLPSHCAALHLKLFPYSHSMFSDDEDRSSTASRSSSPMLQTQPESQIVNKLPPKKRVRTDTVRQASPALSTMSSNSRAKTLARSRSRSLSVALVQERAESVGAISKKRVLNREVSMSRVFKPKPKAKEAPRVLARASTSAVIETQKDLGTMLVEATPVKAHPRPSGLQRNNTVPIRSFSLASEQADEEEEWRLPSSSPDILLLRDSPEDDEDDGMDLTPPTPTKKRRR